MSVIHLKVSLTVSTTTETVLKLLSTYTGFYQDLKDKFIIQKTEYLVFVFVLTVLEGKLAHSSTKETHVHSSFVYIIIGSRYLEALPLLL